MPVCSHVTPFALRSGVSYDRGFRAAVKVNGFVLPGDDFTFACWVRCDRQIIEDGRRIAAQFDRSLLHTADNSWSLETASGGNTFLRFFAAATAGTDPGNNYISSDTGPLTYGVWHHVVCSTSGADGPRLYCDGVRLATTLTGTWPANIRISAEPLFLGMDGDTTDPESGWLGDQAHAMVWSRQLSDQEVLDLYVGYSPNSGRILWLPLDDGQGDTARNIDDPTIPGELQSRSEVPKHTVWITASKAACKRRVLWFGGGTLRGTNSDGHIAGYIRRLVADAVGAAEVDGLVQFVGDYSDGNFAENRHSMLNEDETIETLALRLAGQTLPVLGTSLPPIPTDAILSCGVHDMATFVPTTTVAAYKAGIIDPLLAAGCRVFVTTVLPQTGQPGAENVSLFNTELRLMVEQHILNSDDSLLILVDITTGYDPAWSMNWTAPRERGMPFIAERIATAMRLAWGVS